MAPTITIRGSSNSGDDARDSDGERDGTEDNELERSERGRSDDTRELDVAEPVAIRGRTNNRREETGIRETEDGEEYSASDCDADGVPVTLSVGAVLRGDRRSVVGGSVLRARDVGVTVVVGSEVDGFLVISSWCTPHKP